MTRWPLLLLAAAGLGPLPACLVVEHPLPTVPATARHKPAPPANPAPAPDAAQTAFAEWPTRPGARVPKYPAPPPDEPVAAQIPPAEPGPEPVAPAPPGGVSPARASEPPPFPVPAAPAVHPDPPLVAAVRAFQENRLPDAVEHLKGLDKANQEFVLALLPALVRGAQADLSKANPADATVLCDQLRAAARQVEGRAALRVEKAVFCRRVTGFGRYDPWPDGQPFHPSDLAELYVELRHVPTEPAPGAQAGGFVTRLSSGLELRDAAGRVVEQTDPADWRRTVPVARFDRTEYTRSPPTDYFVKYRFPVPSAAGTYTVTVEVGDPAGGRAARSLPVEFRVAP